MVELFLLQCYIYGLLQLISVIYERSFCNIDKFSISNMYILKYILYYLLNGA